ncbi:MAG: hypothetical protein ACOYL3_12030 [Desulfuromonadaceae bacterium]
MKTIVIWTAAFVAMATLACAGVARTINYQGYLKDAAGKPVTAATSLIFRLYSSTSGVNPVWNESHSVSPANGVYSVGLGEKTPLTIPLNRQYYLGIQVEADSELRPLQMLMAVPYALQAGCNAGDMLNCYTGAPESLNVGLCKSGVRTCTPDGSSFGICAGEVTPNCGGTCLDFSSNTDNCGSCGIACAHVANATPGCTGGVCGFTCTSSYGDCDGLPVNGCETNLTNSVNNCGVCGSRCVYANGYGACSSGVCQLSYCSAGYANCDQNPNTGCETNLMNSASNCGACGNTCSLPNSLSYCQGGACGISYCLAGFSNCDGLIANGCETNTMTSTANCGACGRSCTAANGTAACSQGACSVASCNVSFYNVDGLAANGCECFAPGLNACGTATSLGAMSTGAVQTVSGVLPGGSNERWYAVVVTKSGLFASPRLVLSIAEPGYVADIYQDCAGTAMSCTPGNVGQTGTTCGSVNFNSQVYLLRVRAVQNTGCSQFNLQLTAQ